MNGPSLIREYYRTIDEDDYEQLSSILADGFTHRRPDRTLSGRDRFVRFMREERPETETEHVLDGVYAAESTTEETDRFAAEGRLLQADGSEWFGFVDAFETDDGRIRRLRTYTDG